jgi:hypothetical protein
MTPAQIRQILRIPEGDDLFVEGVGLCFHLDGEIKVSPHATEERRSPNDIDRECFWIDRADLRA